MKPKAKYSRLEGNEYDVELREAQLHDSKSYFTRTLSQAYYFFLHVVILFAALHAYFFYFTSFLGNPIKDIEIYTPAAQALTLVIEERKDTHAHSSFTGFPNSVNTKAWEDLLLPGFFNATAEEILAIGASTKDSVRVGDGGYLASLHVYHDIHCLRRLRLWLYRDTYYPNIEPSRIVDIQRHLDHCIETLRRNTMCRADASVDTFVWTDPLAQKPAMKSTGVRKCVNWEKFENWTMARKIDLHPYVIRPTEGDEG